MNVLGTEQICYMEYLMTFPNQVKECLECGKPVLLPTLFKGIHRCCYCIYERTKHGVQLTETLDGEAYHDELLDWWDRDKCPNKLSCDEECSNCDIPGDMFSIYLQNGRVEQNGKATMQKT